MSDLSSIPKMPKWASDHRFIWHDPIVRRKASPQGYLATPPWTMVSYWCWPETTEVVGGKTYIIPAYCSNPRRCRCGTQLAGHDSGDEDANP